MEKYCRTTQYSDFCFEHDPSLLDGMQSALERILRAIDRKEKIVLYGSYNLDCVVGISLLFSILKYFKADVQYYIPEKNCSEYSLNYEIVKNYFSFLGANLIISVGCGANSIKTFKLCQRLSMDVIVCDYHKPQNEAQNVIMVNPNRNFSRYPFKELTASGLSYKLCMAITRYYESRCLDNSLDLVTLGILSVNEKITNENTIFVLEGLKLFNFSKNVGIRALIDEFKFKSIDLESARNISRTINKFIKNSKDADNAKILVELFTTRDYDKALQISKYIAGRL